MFLLFGMEASEVQNNHKPWVFFSDEWHQPPSLSLLEGRPAEICEDTSSETQLHLAISSSKGLGAGG